MILVALQLAIALALIYQQMDVAMFAGMAIVLGSSVVVGHIFWSFGNDVCIQLSYTN